VEERRHPPPLVTHATVTEGKLLGQLRRPPFVVSELVLPGAEVDKPSHAPAVEVELRCFGLGQADRFSFGDPKRELLVAQVLAPESVSDSESLCPQSVRFAETGDQLGNLLVW